MRDSLRRKALPSFLSMRQSHYTTVAMITTTLAVLYSLQNASTCITPLKCHTNSPGHYQYPHFTDREAEIAGSQDLPSTGLRTRYLLSLSLR
jgi:hypothetical protein